MLCSNSSIFGFSSIWKVPLLLGAILLISMMLSQEKFARNSV